MYCVPHDVKSNEFEVEYIARLFFQIPYVMVCMGQLEWLFSMTWNPY